MSRVRSLAPLFCAGALIVGIILVATLGVNRPGGCGNYGEQECFAQSGCGWLCASPEACYCHTLHDADWAPVTWAVVLAAFAGVAVVVGCVLELRTPSRAYRYDAL